MYLFHIIQENLTVFIVFVGAFEVRTTLAPKEDSGSGAEVLSLWYSLEFVLWLEKGPL